MVLLCVFHCFGALVVLKPKNKKGIIRGKPINIIFVSQYPLSLAISSIYIEIINFLIKVLKCLVQISNRCIARLQRDN